MTPLRRCWWRFHSKIGIPLLNRPSIDRLQHMVFVITNNDNSHSIYFQMNQIKSKSSSKSYIHHWKTIRSILRFLKIKNRDNKRVWRRRRRRKRIEIFCWRIGRQFHFSSSSFSLIANKQLYWTTTTTNQKKRSTTVVIQQKANKNKTK